MKPKTMMVVKRYINGSGYFVKFEGSTGECRRWLDKASNIDPHFFLSNKCLLDAAMDEWDIIDET